MADPLAPENDVAFMRKVQAIVPGIHQDILREKKKEERVLPRSIRRSFRSRNLGKFKEGITRAADFGFTKQQIKEAIQNELLDL